MSATISTQSLSNGVNDSEEGQEESSREKQSHGRHKGGGR
jgi:hypothetical protein